MLRSALLALAVSLPPTIAGGQSLTPQQSGVQSMLQAVSAVNNQIVWVSGHRGTILRTTDGGKNWQTRLVPGAENLEFRDIEALDAERAWALTAGPGNASTISYTGDGGATWTRQFQNTDPDAFYDCMAFFDAKTGVAFSDASQGRTNILRTTDAGVHWTLLPIESVPTPLEKEGAFASSGGCVTAIDARHGFIALGGPGARFLRTTDAGATWSVHQTPFVRGASAGMTAASFRDPNNGIAVAGVIGNYQKDTSSAAVGVTSDGGKTWTLVSRPPLPSTPFGVMWVPGTGRNTALIAAPGGIFVSQDAGKSWATLQVGNFWSVGAASKVAWVVGAGGKIVRVDF